MSSLALAGSGVLFVLYPAIRPFSDELSMQGARAFNSSAWLLAHGLAMLAFILLVLGLLGLFLRLQGSPQEGLMLQALVVSWLGVGLTLPFYGAETFGLHAIGQAALLRLDPTLVDLASAVRSGVGLYIFALGLGLLAVGAVMVALAAWKSPLLAKWSGLPLALGFLLYLPQFALSQPLRVAHGALVAAGCVWLALALWRSEAQG